MSDVCICMFYVCKVIGFVDWLDRGLIYMWEEFINVLRWPCVVDWTLKSSYYYYSSCVRPSPSPPPQLVLSSSSFPPLFPSFLSLASSAVCLPDCLELNWNIVDNLTKHCFLNPVVLIPCSQRCCSRLSQPSWKTNIACHNTVYCVGHGRLSRTCFSPFPTQKSRSQVF